MSDTTIRPEDIRDALSKHVASYNPGAASRDEIGVVTEAAPSSAGRESTTRESSCRQKGQFTGISKKKYEGLFLLLRARKALKGRIGTIAALRGKTTPYGRDFVSNP